jgi:hypothetical protein
MLDNYHMYVAMEVIEGDVVVVFRSSRASI